MSSLRSSSALAYNFFAPWRGCDLGPLGEALGEALTDGSVVFERKFPHGLPSEPPNLDVVLDGEQTRPLAIECKFTEPYGAKRPHQVIAAKYFANGRKRWTEVGLPRCQELAEAVGGEAKFMRLGVGQLLKHVLGLAYSTRSRPRLVCLWYDTACSEAAEHRSELTRFSAYTTGEVDFRATTYQESFKLLRHRADPVPGYREYLEDRYFAV